MSQNILAPMFSRCTFAYFVWRATSCRCHLANLLPLPAIKVTFNSYKTKNTVLQNAQEVRWATEHSVLFCSCDTLGVPLVWAYLIFDIFWHQHHFQVKISRQDSVDLIIWVVWCGLVWSRLESLEWSRVVWSQWSGVDWFRKKHFLNSVNSGFFNTSLKILNHKPS